MSAYLLGTISRQLDQIVAKTGQPTGVPVSQYNDLVVRFNEMSQAYANEANVSAQLREYAEDMRARWYGLRDKGLLMEEQYKASEAELKSEIQRLRAIVNGVARAA